MPLFAAINFCELIVGIFFCYFSLVKAIDKVDGALTAILIQNSSTWKSVKKSKKGDKMPRLRFVGGTLWNTVKEVDFSTNSRNVSFVMHLQCHSR